MPSGKGNRERRMRRSITRGAPEQRLHCASSSQSSQRPWREPALQEVPMTAAKQSAGFSVTTLRDFRSQGSVKLKHWLLNSSLTAEQRMGSAEVIVGGFWESLENDLYPEEDIETIFGVKRSLRGVTEEHLCNRGIGELVFGCWMQAFLYSDDVTEESVFASLCRGDLPQSYRKWMTDLSESGESYCMELERRSQWDKIPWDYEMLSVLSGLAIRNAAPQNLSSGCQITWLKISNDKEGMCKGALRQGLVQTKYEIGLQGMVARKGWIRFRCTLLEALGENISLYAERPDGRRWGDGRNNIVATFMTCDSNSGLAPSTIHGEAVLVRQDGEDLTHATVEKLCHYIDSMMDIWPQWRSAADLNRALGKAMGNWKNFSLGDKLLVDGTLKKTASTKAKSDLGCLDLKALQKQVDPPEVQGQQAPIGGIPGSTQNVEQTLVLLKFSRNPQAFHDCLQSGIELNECRMSIEEAGLSYRLPCGAYVLLPPILHEFLLDHIREEELELGPGHVIMLEDLEDPFMKALNSLPRKYKISVRAARSSMEGRSRRSPKIMSSRSASRMVLSSL